MKPDFNILRCITFCLLVVLCSSCAFTGRMFSQEANIHYVGETLSASQNIETFYDEHDIKRSYRVIGRMTNDIMMQYKVEDLKDLMQQKAREVGGDAIIITDISPARVENESDKVLLKAKVIKYL